MSTNVLQKGELTIWDLISRSQGWKISEAQNFALEREHLAGLVRSLHRGESPLSATHRAIVGVLGVLLQGGMTDLTLEEYVPESAPPGTIDQIVWADGTCGLFVALPWDPDRGNLAVEALAMDFAIGAARLAQQPDGELVTIAWVSGNPDILMDGKASNYAIRTYSREQLRGRWPNYSERIKKTIAAVARPPGPGERGGGQLPIIPPPPAQPSSYDDAGSGILLQAVAQVAAELSAVRQSLESIAQALEGNKPWDPFVYPLSRFKSFDFASIGIEVEESDSEGPVHLVYRGRIYTRRSPDNKKFAPIIFFSRSIGKDDEDNNNYECLIKFKTFSGAESLDPRAAKLAGVGQ